MHTVFINHKYNEELLDLPVLVILEKWKRQRTKSQNIKLEKLNAYVSHDRVRSHSIKVRKEIEEVDFKNISKIIMHKVDKTSSKVYDTLRKRAEEAPGKSIYSNIFR